MIQAIDKVSREQAAAFNGATSNGHAVMPVPSLDDVLARCRALKSTVDAKSANTLEDLEKLPGEWFEHPTLGQRLRVGPMSGTGYAELLAVPRYVAHDGEMRKISGESRDRRARDLILIHRGVLWPQLTPEAATAIYDAPLCGPDNVRLVSTIEQYNPPTDELDARMAVLLGSDSVLIILWNVVLNANLLPNAERILRLPESELSQEDLAVKVMLEGVMALLQQLNKWYEIDATAKKLNIPLTMAGALVAAEGRRQLGEATE